MLPSSPARCGHICSSPRQLQQRQRLPGNRGRDAPLGTGTCQPPGLPSAPSVPITSSMGNWEPSPAPQAAAALGLPSGICFPCSKGFPALPNPSQAAQCLPSFPLGTGEPSPSSQASGALGLLSGICFPCSKGFPAPPGSIQGVPRDHPGIHPTPGAFPQEKDKEPSSCPLVTPQGQRKRNENIPKSTLDVPQDESSAMEMESEIFLGICYSLCCWFGLTGN